MPAQFSLPHSPVANDQVSDLRLVGITANTGCNVPVTAELITLVLQFMLTVTSLYGPNRNGPGGRVVDPPPPPGGVVVPPPPGGVVVPPPPPAHPPVEVHG
jgi:hypothetical protein